MCVDAEQAERIDTTRVWVPGSAGWQTFSWLADMRVASHRFDRDGCLVFQVHNFGAQGPQTTPTSEGGRARACPQGTRFAKDRILRVRADSDEELVESNETNNAIFIGPRADIVVTGSDGHYDRQNARVCTEVILRNAGGNDVLLEDVTWENPYWTQVRLTLLDASASCADENGRCVTGSLIKSGVFFRSTRYLGPGRATAFTQCIGVDRAPDGRVMALDGRGLNIEQLRLGLIVDPENRLGESDEDNNRFKLAIGR